MKFQKGHKINLGRKQTESHRRNIGLANSIALKGRVPWNKGKIGAQKWTESQREKMKGIKNGMFGKRHTERARQLIRQKATGRKRTLASRFKQRRSMIGNPNRKFKDTNIELKVEAELQRRNINYQKQVPLCKIAIVDFYLPEYRIVIQCDGDYWHSLPKQKEKDIRQDTVLTFNGFNVYRFWEHEINKSVKECINRLCLK